MQIEKQQVVALGKYRENLIAELIAHAADLGQLGRFRIEPLDLEALVEHGFKETVEKIGRLKTNPRERPQRRVVMERVYVN